MYAKNLERILALLCERSDVSHSYAQEFADRFQTLRDYGRLPRGRERREQKLSGSEIAAAILGLASMRPNWAGHAAIVLSKLQPVGGTGASFLEAGTLGDAVVILLSEEQARKRFIRLTVTVAETATNSHGGAEIVYRDDGDERHAHFVPGEAVSLLAPGREVGFDPQLNRRNAPVMREMSFNQAFFERLANEIELAQYSIKPSEGDGSEYNAEEVENERYRKLGVRNGSRFLNIGVDNQVTWPREEKRIQFDDYTLVLMPKTKDNVQSVHIDLTANKLDHRQALTIINRFLSILSWCHDNFAIVQGGWSGNPVPVPVSKRDLAFTTASDYFFYRKIPPTAEARRALAFYREARNAQEVGLISYAVLNYYKIIEIKYHTKEAVRGWFRAKFEALRTTLKDNDDVARFLALCGTVPAHVYIHDSCRIAVAHAGKKSKSDPDEVDEIDRLSIAGRVMHLLARQFIMEEFAISDLTFSGD